jgi:hypothetical protein
VLVGIIRRHFRRGDPAPRPSRYLVGKRGTRKLAGGYTGWSNIVRCERVQGWEGRSEWRPSGNRDGGSRGGGGGRRRLWKYTRVERRFRVLSGETASWMERASERASERERESTARAFVSALRARRSRSDVPTRGTEKRRKEQRERGGEGGEGRNPRGFSRSRSRVSGASLRLKHSRLRQQPIRPGPRSK